MKDLRLLARFNASWSDSSLGEFYDADYMEAVAAFAYRPVDNDRLNMLFKYTYFADLPTAAQISSWRHAGRLCPALACSGH